MCCELIAKHGSVVSCINFHNLYTKIMLRSYNPDPRISWMPNYIVQLDLDDIVGHQVYLMVNTDRFESQHWGRGRWHWQGRHDQEGVSIDPGMNAFTSNSQFLSACRDQQNLLHCRSLLPAAAVAIELTKIDAPISIVVMTCTSRGRGEGEACCGLLPRPGASDQFEPTRPATCRLSRS